MSTNHYTKAQADDKFAEKSSFAKTVGYITASDSTIVGGSYARKSGNVVTLLVYATGCTNETFAILPQGFIPSERTLVVGFGGTSPTTLEPKLVSLNPNGKISNAHDSVTHDVWILHCTYVV